MKYPPIRSHVENPYAEIGEDAKKAESKHILNLIYEFIRFSLDQFVIKYGEVIRAQPRLKSYLAQRNTVDKLRAFLLEVNRREGPRLGRCLVSRKLFFYRRVTTGERLQLKIGFEP